MSNVELRIERTDGGNVVPGANVVFNNVALMTGISYNPATGVITFLQAGTYIVNWLVVTQTSISMNGSVFALSSSVGDFIQGNSNLKAGEVSGFGKLIVTTPGETLSLRNASTASVVYSSLVPIKAALHCLKNFQATLDLLAQPATLDLLARPATLDLSAQPATLDLSAQPAILDLSARLATLDLSARLATLDLLARLATLDLSARLATLDLSAQPATLDLLARLATLDLLARLATLDLSAQPVTLALLARLATLDLLAQPATLDLWPDWRHWTHWPDWRHWPYWPDRRHWTHWPDRRHWPYRPHW